MKGKTKRINSIIAKVLAFIMVFQMAAPMSLLAEPLPDDGDNVAVEGTVEAPTPDDADNAADDSVETPSPDGADNAAADDSLAAEQDVVSEIENDTFTDAHTYAIVSKGAAAYQTAEDDQYGVNGGGWNFPVKFSQEAYADGKIYREYMAKACFIIEKKNADDYNDITINDNQTLVAISKKVGDKTYPLRCEKGGAVDYVFIDDQARGADDVLHLYILTKGEGDQYTIQGASHGHYVGYDAGTMKMLMDEQTEPHSLFTFIEDPESSDTAGEIVEEPDPECDKYFMVQHKETEKFVKTYRLADTPLTVDGEIDGNGVKFTGIGYTTNSNWNTAGTPEKPVMSFRSLYNNCAYSVIYSGGAKADYVRVYSNANPGGWESMQFIPNGNGTFVLKDSHYDKFITVDSDNYLECQSEKTAETLTDNERFVLRDYESSNVFEAPNKATALALSEDGRTNESLTFTWINPSKICTDIEVAWTKEGETVPAGTRALTSEELASGECTLSGLEGNTKYSITLTASLKYYLKDATQLTELKGEASDALEAETRALAKPEAPENVELEVLDDGKYELSWDASEYATEYAVMRAPSLFAKEDLVETIETIAADDDTGRYSCTVDPSDVTEKYSDYYRIVAIAEVGEFHEESDPSEAASLEINLFGDHTVIIAETDDETKVNERVQEIFVAQNDYANDAQFNSDNWTIYYKPGDYTDTECVPVGFYTHVAGLGKVPDDVQLNNIEVPAYLDGARIGASNINDYWIDQANGSGNAANATCSFWRTVENLAVTGTGDATVTDKVAPQSFGNWNPEKLTWAVAQAAPIRRVHSTRNVVYDWDYGWASGGYTADCLFEGNAGTDSGQQYYTRNSVIKGNQGDYQQGVRGAFGTTLNNFLQGVVAPNIPTSQNNYKTDYVYEYYNNEGALIHEEEHFTRLKKGNGYTSWQEGKVTTAIEKTDKIAEKPFLYLDGDEYKVFVPAVQNDTVGISWGEGKENGGMGAGTSLSLLDSFYVAKPEDSAAKINEQLATGKSIFFTPGKYHAEVPIQVTNPNTILLGSGMTSIIPDNPETAVKVSDVSGVRIAGLIFDAGLSSDYLLVVGESGSHKNHAKNPIILQDLFFRVGGTTDVLTKSEDALKIDSNDVICDHFWIWRADHGAGVEWYGNESKHGIIVNGDDVSCYALFNEHFQEYDVLWNGEYGKTYFLQNEKCYDPISQEAWMSHNGTVKGYSAYKVSNDVKNHYAVGLGVYNVFIYTGPDYESGGAGIEMENAIEVPNTENVLVENACIQTFAKEDGVLQRFNHIINGVGDGVGSGTDPITGEAGGGWSRKFLLWYNNGKAVIGASDENADGGANNTTEEIEGGIIAPADEVISTEQLEALYNQYKDVQEADCTANSWKNAGVTTALEKAASVIDEVKGITLTNQAEIAAKQTEINTARKQLEAAVERLIFVGEANKLYTANKDKEQGSYTDESWDAFTTALAALKTAINDGEATDTSVKTEIYKVQTAIDTACTRLEMAVEKLSTSDSGDDYQNRYDAAIGDLEEAIVSANSLKKEDYTTASWDVYYAALKEANSIIANGSTIAKAQAALAKIEETKAALVKAQDATKDSLNVELEKASEYEAKKDEYTPESWADYEAALNAARTLLGNEDATTAQLKAALNALEVARKALITPLDAAKKGLQEELSKANRLDESDYTSESWAEYKKALDAANALGEDASADQINAAAAALAEARGKLVEVEPVDPNPPVTTLKGIKLSQTSVTLQVNGTLKLTVTADPEGAILPTVKWSVVPNNGVVSVDQSGNVKALKAGSATIVAATEGDEPKTATCSITVTGSTGPSNPGGNPSNPGGNPSNPGGNPSNPGGNPSNPGGNQNQPVKVGRIKITGISNKIAAGKKVKLTAVVTPDNATNKAVTWSSSNKKYATVNKSGTVSMKKAGAGKKVTITATAADGSGVKATYKITIMKAAVKSIKLKASKTSVKAGKSVTVKATVTPTKNVNKTLKWTSSNTKFATVNSKGKVTTKKAGAGKTVTITATATDGSNKKAKVKIKITK